MNAQTTTSASPLLFRSTDWHQGLSSAKLRKVRDGGTYRVDPQEQYVPLQVSDSCCGVGEERS
jgi:hypothetical protein